MKNFNIPNGAGSGRSRNDGQFMNNTIRMPKLNFDQLEGSPEPEEDEAMGRVEMNQTIGTQFKSFGSKLLNLFGGDTAREALDQYHSARSHYSEHENNLSFLNKTMQSGSRNSPTKSPLQVTAVGSLTNRTPTVFTPIKEEFQMNPVQELSSEDELDEMLVNINFHWETFKSEHQKYSTETAQPQVEAISPLNCFIKPHLVEVRKILLREDETIYLVEHSSQLQNIGDCMEYALNIKMFAELAMLAKENKPRDMFIICTEFFTTVCGSIKAIPIMHNNRVHVQLVKVLKQMADLIRDGGLVQENGGDGSVQETYVVTILTFIDMITEHALNKDREIVKFYAQSQKPTPSCSSRLSSLSQ